jgi:O-succinylhomoserine sulfhydrylase
VDAASRNAQILADLLAAHPAVTRVWYPTRADHPGRELALRQMSGGGTLVSFEVAGGKQAAFALMNALRIIVISNNLGDSKSMVTHPGTTTHMRIGAEERARLGITDGVVRLSVGIEDARDLAADLAGALDTIRHQAAAE